ncbi:MAG: carboxypeptidase-like regulatory domain-containing protein [Bacteroidaceae bacterium]|nr:carboxypeptidase-like regulatory domain-containing protein [Bacteroidaceae bacterium]
MKHVQLRKILLCLLLFVGVAVRAQVDIYGFAINVNDETQSGLVKFSSIEPKSMQRIKQLEEWATAGAWGGDAYYAMLSYATYPKGLYTIDIETGEVVKQVADYMYNEKVRAAIEMSYDFTTGVMYMLTVSDDNPGATAFGTVDLTTGEQTIINHDMKQYVVAMAIDKDGIVYGINNDGAVVKIEKSTGICDRRFSLDVTPFRRQSMEFDRKTGDLYWACCNSSKMGMLKKLNVKKRTCVDVGYIGGTAEEQVLGLYIPYSPCADGAPGKVEGLKITPDATGLNALTLTWKNPTTTYSGDSLVAIEKVEIYRDGTLVYTLKGVQPGTEESWTDQLNSKGSYTYKLQVYNAEGAGIPVSVSAFAGHDTPKEVIIASVSREGNNAVRLSWFPCTEGVNGGYLDLSTISYRVKRLSDGMVLAEGLTDTTYVDATITELGRYQYGVEAVNADGTSKTAITAYIVNGPARELPLVTDFTDEAESQLWSIADADGDGTTFFWQYNPNFKDQGFFYYQCEYTPATNANDWIISPKYKFEAGKAYKAIVHVRPDDIYKNEMMEIYLVKDYNLATSINLSDTIRVTGDVNELGETILSQFRINIDPLDEAGEYSLAVRCISNMEVAYWLAVAKVEVSENLEGHIRGDVYDDELNPVEGVVVSLEGTEYKAITDARGQFEIKNVSEGTYTTVQTKIGYFTIPQTVTVKGLKTVNVELDVKKRWEYSYEGNVKNEYGEPLANATISITGYNEYQTVTDVNGDYQITSIYALTEEEEPYTIKVHKDFYQTVSFNYDFREVSSNKKSRDFVLNDEILPPAYVSVLLDMTTNGEGEHARISWSKPAIESFVKLHSEEVSYTFGTEEGEEGTLIGLVCREPVLIDSLYWWTFCDSTSLNVVILPLNKNGHITGEELYRDDEAPNNPYNTTMYRLKESVYAPHGCFIGISIDKGNLSLLTTSSTSEYPFVKQTNAYIEDLASAIRLEYVEDLGVDYEENFYMGYFGRRVADEEAPQVSYQIVALADETELYSAVAANDFLYEDYAWGNLEKGDYRYAVEAMYRNGEKARLFSDVITKKTPSGISSVAKSKAVQQNGNILLIDAEAVQVISTNGETIVCGTNITTLGTDEWADGLYIVRTLNDGQWTSHKLVIK